MFKRLSKRAQTTAEYAILIAIVVGAVVAMQVYVRRGLQGRIKSAVDYTGNATSAPWFNGTQYEPYYMSATGKTKQDVTDTEKLTTTGNYTKGTAAYTNATRNQTTGW